MISNDYMLEMLKNGNMIIMDDTDEYVMYINGKLLIYSRIRPLRVIPDEKSQLGYLDGILQNEHFRFEEEVSKEYV